MASYTSWLGSVPCPTGDSPTLQFLGRWGYRLYEERDILQMELHLLLAALFPIYIGSHAALRCPPSASDPAKKASKGSRSLDPEDNDLLDIEVENAVEGLTPSDAILLPVIASLTLAGLYFLIKWLNDPALINKILGYYFSVLGIFGVGKLAGDALNVGITFIFPSVWSSGSEVYFIDPLLSQQFTNSPTSKGPNRALLHRKFTEKVTPFPGFLSNLKLSNKSNRAVWAIRALFTDRWIFRAYVHGLLNTKTRVRLNDVIGFLIGVAAIVLYNYSGKVWWLTNLMGFGFCYGTVQLMSPTTFWTGSLVLAGLFIYDIVMVFYTPLMVTVATTLDVPIKLVFPGPNRGGMLGLGDIVLPGIMMALALRFDLYLYYLRKPSPPAHIHSLEPSSSSKPKPTYESAKGKWGERWWTRSLPVSALPPSIAGSIFPKVYFYASVVGYVLGMVVTVIVLNVFHHAQPALLYLVPGVLGALWGTALARGELGLMWNYSEAGDTEDQKTEAERKEAAKKAVEGGREWPAVSEREKGKESELETEKAGELDDERKIEKVNGKDTEKKDTESKKRAAIAAEHAHHVFLFSLISPSRAPTNSKLLNTHT